MLLLTLFVIAAATCAVAVALRRRACAKRTTPRTAISSDPGDSGAYYSDSQAEPPGPKGAPIFGCLADFLLIPGDTGDHDPQRLVSKCRAHDDDDDEHHPSTANSMRLSLSDTSSSSTGSRHPGCLWDWARFWRLRRVPVADVFAAWGAEFRSGVVAAAVCGNRFVVLNDHESMSRALTHPRGLFDFRPNDRLFLVLGGRGLISAQGPAHQKNRRFVMRAFRDLGVGKSAATNVIRTECWELIQHLQERNGRPMDTRDSVAKAVFNVTSSFLSGQRFDWDDRQLLQLAACADSATDMEAAGVFNFIPWLMVPFFYGLGPLSALKSLFKIYAFARTASEARRKLLVRQPSTTFSCDEKARTGRGDGRPGINDDDNRQHLSCCHSNAKPANLIDFYILASTGKFKVEPSQAIEFDKELLPTVRDMFVAGLETTTTALRWAFLLLAVHPRVQQKMQLELDQFRREYRERVRDEPRENEDDGCHGSSETFPTIRYEEREKLPYVEAVILEVLRWCSVIPMLSHGTGTEPGFIAATPGKIQDSKTTCDGDRNLRGRGFAIPADTPVYMNVHAAHRDQRVWPNSPDLTAFDPRHFWDPLRNTVVNRDKILSFSMGKRRCLGEGLARQELFCFITSIVQNFCIHLPERTSSEDQTTFSFSKYGMTWAPPDHKLRFLPRTIHFDG